MKQPDISPNVSVAKDTSLQAVVEFSRPLLLTPGQDLAGYIGSRVGRALIFLITCVSVLAVLLIFYFIIREAVPFVTLESVKTSLARISEFLTSKNWFPEHEEHPEFGALTIIVGSIYVTVVALILAVPFGVLSAIFLSDIAPFTVREIVKPVIELLAAIPSVAYGFFAIVVVAPWLQNKFGFTTGANALNAAMILALMAVPTIISVAEDSLSAIGREIREASYGLGATRTETMLKVVIPAAHSGIIASIILGMMRAIGETMVVWMAAGMAAQVPSPWWDLSQSVRPITATIAQEMGETPQGTPHYYSLFALGVLLLIFTFGLNMVSEHFMSRVKHKGGSA
ncbi:MAG: phosphate ABC transporter permease subunit PstC [Sedimentisphaerales bacterium]|nr:phosphate ABC transporter permease subunit PstC [Sedimentisphaerales bacterium]